MGGVEGRLKPPFVEVAIAIFALPYSSFWHPSVRPHVPRGARYAALSGGDSVTQMDTKNVIASVSWKKNP